MDKGVPIVGVSRDPESIRGGYPGPRGKRRKRSVWRKTILPLLKLCVIASLAFFVISAAFSKISRPIKLLSRESRETHAVARQLAALKRENINLERRIRYLKSPRGAEQRARELGYVKPGEITLVFPE